jgi:hypothetical protein
VQIQNAVGNIYGLGVPKFHTVPIPEEGRLTLKTLYLQEKYLNMAAKDPGTDIPSIVPHQSHPGRGEAE